MGLVPWQYLQEPGKGADGCCEAQWLDERGLVGLRLPLQLICSVIQGTGRGWQGWGHSAREDIQQLLLAPQEHQEVLMALTSLTRDPQPQLLPTAQEPHCSSVPGHTVLP